MPETYEYKVRDAGGKLISGTLVVKGAWDTAALNRLIACCV